VGAVRIAEKIGLERAPMSLDRHLVEAPDRTDPGVVDPEVQPAEALASKRRDASRRRR
jgi:hypothetical protein